MNKHGAAMLGCVVACGALLTACGAHHFVQRGADLYAEGRYVEADEVFERSEPRLAQAPLDARAAYAAYRGATFMALGDFEHAERWLRLASAIEHGRPGTLSRRERSFLDGSLRELEQHRMQAPPDPNAAVIASAGQPPTGSSAVETGVGTTERGLTQP